MSIVTCIDRVEANENGSGSLILGRNAGGEEISRLDFDEAPAGVKRLEGARIWGVNSVVMLGDNTIARRMTKSLIRFVPDKEFDEAVEDYEKSNKHAKPR